MNSDLYNFTSDFSTLSADDMFLISQELNTIEPGVGEVARAAPLLESLTFLDWVSIAFIMTIIIFAIGPKISEKLGFFKTKQKAH